MQKIDNLSSIIIALCKIFRVPYSENEITELVQSHPYFPSLATLIDITKELGLQTDAYKFEYKDLRNINIPFVAHLNIKGGVFAIITEVEEERISYKLDGGKELSIDREEFCGFWDNIVMTVENENKRNNLGYLKARIVENKISILFISTIIFMNIMLFENINTIKLDIEYLLLILTKIGGLFFIWLMMKHELGNSNSLIQKICNFSKLSDCNAVLNSKGARLAGIFKLSDIGLIWFLSTLIYLLYFVDSSIEYLIPIKIFTLCSIPFIVYTVTYQTFFIKKICPLCIGVISMLIIDVCNTLIFSNLSTLNWNRTVFYWIPFFTTILGTSLIWIVIYESIMLKNRNKTFIGEYLRIKRNPEYIQNLIYKSDREIVNVEELKSPIKITDNGSNDVFTEIISLYCSPCKDSLEKIQKMINYIGDDGPDIQFVIHCNAKDINMYSTKAEVHLIAIAAENNPDKTWKSLTTWYEIMNYEEWSELFPVVLDESHIAILRSHNEWIKSNHIKGTPTAYLNSKEIPNEVDVEDLKYIFV